MDPFLFANGADDPVTAVVVIVLAIVLLPVLLILAAALVAGLEFLLLLVVLPLAVLGRVLFGRRWRVEVRRGWRPYCEELAGDWQRSGVRIHELADDLRRGQLPQQTLGLEDWPT